MTQWHQAMISVLKRLPEYFTLEDVYNFIPELQRQFPDNNTIDCTIRRVLQELRDMGYVAFLDEKGHYRKLK